MNFVMQLTSILGAGLILGAFLGLQRRWWTSEKRGYLWCNFIGAVILMIVALWDRRVGFVILEFSWAAVSLISLIRTGRPPSSC